MNLLPKSCKIFLFSQQNSKGIFPLFIFVIDVSKNAKDNSSLNFTLNSLREIIKCKYMSDYEKSYICIILYCPVFLSILRYRKNSTPELMNIMVYKEKGERKLFLPCNIKNVCVKISDFNEEILNSLDCLEKRYDLFDYSHSNSNNSNSDSNPNLLQAFKLSLLICKKFNCGKIILINSSKFDRLNIDKLGLTKEFIESSFSFSIILNTNTSKDSNFNILSLKNITNETNGRLYFSEYADCLNSYIFYSLLNELRTKTYYDCLVEFKCDTRCVLEDYIGLLRSNKKSNSISIKIPSMSL